MTKYIVLSLALVAALVAVNPSVPKAMAQSANLPTGIYTTTITEADLPDSVPPEFIPILVGVWEIEFTESGSYIVGKDGYPAAVGRYNSTPGRIVMTDLQGPLACTDAPGIASATYRWTLAGNELVLTTVNDRCVGRNLVLIAHPLQRQ
jgi:hypothetical protein